MIAIITDNFVCAPVSYLGNLYTKQRTHPPTPVRPPPHTSVPPCDTPVPQYPLWYRSTPMKLALVPNVHHTVRTSPVACLVNTNLIWPHTQADRLECPPHIPSLNIKTNIGQIIKDLVTSPIWYSTSFLSLARAPMYLCPPTIIQMGPITYDC